MTKLNTITSNVSAALPLTTLEYILLFGFQGKETLLNGLEETLKLLRDTIITLKSHCYILLCPETP